MAMQIKQMASYQKRPGKTVSQIFSSLMQEKNLTDKDFDELEAILQKSKK